MKTQCIRAKKQSLKKVYYCCAYPGCSSEYMKRYNLQQHILSAHLKLRKFECEVCQARFTTKQSCQQHQYIHSSQRHFRCSKCHLTCNQLSQLRLHTREHINQARLNEGIYLNYSDFIEEINDADKVKERGVKIIRVNINTSEMDYGVVIPKIKGPVDARVLLPSFSQMFGRSNHS